MAKFALFFPTEGKVCSKMVMAFQVARFEYKSFHEFSMVLWFCSCSTLNSQTLENVGHILQIPEVWKWLVQIISDHVNEL